MAETIATTMVQTVTVQIAEFVLHDGEDVERTDALHEFLGQTEWEGDESGVTLQQGLHVEVGDTIVRVQGYDGLLVRRAPKTEAE